MLHGKLCAGEETWAPEVRIHRWKNDQLEDLHNNNALWGFMIRASEEFRLMDHTKFRDPVMRRLLQTLGAEGVIPGRYIESFLRVFKQSTHTLPSM